MLIEPCGLSIYVWFCRTQDLSGWRGPVFCWCVCLALTFLLSGWPTLQITVKASASLKFWPLCVRWLRVTGTWSPSQSVAVMEAEAGAPTVSSAPCLGPSIIRRCAPWDLGTPLMAEVSYGWQYLCFLKLNQQQPFFHSASKVFIFKQQHDILNWSCKITLLVVSHVFISKTRSRKLESFFFFGLNRSYGIQDLHPQIWPRQCLHTNTSVSASQPQKAVVGTFPLLTIWWSLRVTATKKMFRTAVWSSVCSEIIRKHSDEK